MENEKTIGENEGDFCRSACIKILLFQNMEWTERKELLDRYLKGEHICKLELPE